MIVDVHTRIWESREQLGAAAEGLARWHAEPWDRPSASAAEHGEAMAPVANAIVLGLESKLLGASIPPEKVAQYVQASGPKSLGFAGLDPAVGPLVRRLEEAARLGLVGVVLSPAAQGFHPVDTRVMGLYEACEARGMPILFEPGLWMGRQAKMEFAQPMLLDEVARTFPKLKLILGSLGSPFIEQGLTLIARHPTVFGEVSELIPRPWQLYNALVQAHQQGAIARLLLGSGFPLGSPEKAIVTLYSVNTLVQGTHLPVIPREQLRTIVERDALACLGLVAPERQEDKETRRQGEGEPRLAGAAQPPVFSGGTPPEVATPNPDVPEDVAR